MLWILLYLFLAQNMNILYIVYIMYSSWKHRLSLKGTRTLSARNITAWFRFINQSGMPTAAILLVASLPFATNNLGSQYAEAQSSATATNTQDEQSDNVTIQSFHFDGAIGSLVTDLLNSTTTIGQESISDSAPIYVLVGNWSLDVVNGEANYLQVDFIMGLQNGTQMHVNSIENFQNEVILPSSQNSSSSPGDNLSGGLFLTPANNYSLSLFGYVDVLVDETVKWQNVPISINIFNGNTISILLDTPSTDNNFKGQPIYGIVTWILDANDQPIKPSIWVTS